MNVKKIEREDETLYLIESDTGSSVYSYMENATNGGAFKFETSWGVGDTSIYLFSVSTSKVVAESEFTMGDKVVDNVWSDLTGGTVVGVDDVKVSVYWPMERTVYRTPPENLRKV